MGKKDSQNNSGDANSSLINKWLKRIIVAAVVAVIIVTTLYFYHFNGIFSTENAEWGTFGDFIGGTLNPILSFLALIALLLTIVLQSKEMADTRKQLERAADAQTESKSLLDKQMETQRLQQFESTFFSLLNQLQGEYKNIEKNLDHIHSFVFEPNQKIHVARDRLNEKNRTVGRYFKILYQTLKFIKTSLGESGPQLEKRYSNIVRALMTDATLQLLAVNCYCDSDKDSYWSYKLLIERYEFLEHMPFKYGGSGDYYSLFQLKNEYFELKAFGKSVHVSRLHQLAN